MDLAKVEPSLPNMGNSHCYTAVKRKKTPPSECESHPMTNKHLKRDRPHSHKRKDREMDAEIRELFRIFDKNRDNTISCKELGKAFKVFGLPLSEEEVQQVADELDPSGSGKIEYKEFYNFMVEQLKKAEDPQKQDNAVRMAFKVFDKNEDGFIDASELRAVMQNMGEPLSEKEVSDMMKEAAVDDDGRVNYEDFINTWTATATSTK
ncbi:neo-calmodulin-like isoform X1 [Haliotis rufescens]|uniref:neo-calmodulin-like isoform X1 n=2 Tax=Haliotis rufescens TaxID=6454 RepID=UPI001EAFB02E|nr:neo-calmodulin-like isoform X1 [Haliotis rufescens]